MSSRCRGRLLWAGPIVATWPSAMTTSLCIQSLAKGLCFSPQAMAISLSPCGKTRSLLAVWISTGWPRHPTAMQAHSTCQPGRALPQGVGQKMPAFSDSLTDPEIAQLVAYLRAKHRPAPPPATGQTAN